jgi:hypothetical protein
MDAGMALLAWHPGLKDNPSTSISLLIVNYQIRLVT